MQLNNFIFFVSFNSDILFSINFGVSPTGLFLGLRKGSNTVSGSTYVVERLSFCMFLSILIFDFCLILVSFLKFGALMGYF